MATSKGKLSKSFFIKLLVGIIILPFVFWGMGDVFRGGNQNVVATVESEKIVSLDPRPISDELKKESEKSKSFKEICFRFDYKIN